MKIIWDIMEERIYSQGVSCGVLYPENAPGVPWNGLISITERGDQLSAAKYFDGQRYMNKASSVPFSGIISAFTYPDEFEPYIGVSSVFTAQTRHSFGLSWRTNRELHLVYNALTRPSPREYSSHSEEINFIPFQWEFTTLPENIPGGKSASHLVIMIDDAPPGAISDLEDLIYGNDFNDPQIPSPADILEIFESHTSLRITNNEDGTWNADGPDSAISVTDDIIEISWPSVEMLNDSTFKIKSSYVSGYEAVVPRSDLNGHISMKKMTVGGSGGMPGISSGSGHISKKKMSISGYGSSSSLLGWTQIQKGSTVTGIGSVTLTCIPTNAHNLLVAHLSGNDGANAFTGSGGDWQRAGQSAGYSTVARSEIWCLDDCPSGIESATFHCSSGKEIKGFLAEYSPPSGWHGMVDSYGHATVDSGHSQLVVTAEGPNALGDLALAQFTDCFSASPSGSWTVNNWTRDRSLSSGDEICFWGGHRTGMDGRPASFIGATPSYLSEYSSVYPKLAAFSEANAMIGPIGIVKNFYSTLPATWTDMEEYTSGLPSNVVSIICYTVEDTHVASLINSLPSDRLWLICFRQEPEGDGTASNYKAGFHRQSNLIRQQGKKNILVVSGHASYRYRNGGDQDVLDGDWIPPSADMDVLAFDDYQGGNSGWPSQGLRNQDRFQNFLKVALPRKKPIAISEYGVNLKGLTPDSVTSRSGRLGGDAVYLKEAFTPGGPNAVSDHPLMWWVYWQSSWDAAHSYFTTASPNDPDGTYKPHDPAAVTTWTSMAEGTPLSVTAQFGTAVNSTGWAGVVVTFRRIPRSVIL